MRKNKKEEIDMSVKENKRLKKAFLKLEEIKKVNENGFDEFGKIKEKAIGDMFENYKELYSKTLKVVKELKAKGIVVNEIAEAVMESVLVLERLNSKRY